MMAFGSYSSGSGGGVGPVGGGSSSSSSNLSALAPPFMVDKSFSKPHLNNSVNYNTEVPYTTRFDPSIPIWPHHHLQHQHHSLTSPPSGSNYLEPEPVGASRTTPSDIYGGFSSDPQLSNSTNPHYALLSPVATTGAATTFDLFTYDKYPNSNNLSASGLVEPKPYYPPYVSSNGYDDNCHPVAHQEPRYELLSNSGNTTQLGGSSQVSFNQSMSCMKYPPPTWDHYYGGSADGESRTWKQFKGTFDSKGYKVSDAPSCRSYAHPEEHAAESFSSYKDASAVSDNCYDSFGGRFHFSFPETEDGNTFLQSNPKANNIDCSKESPVNFMLNVGPPHIQESVAESSRDFYNSQNWYGTSGNPISAVGTSLFGGISATKAPPVAVIKPPSSGSGKSARSAKNVIEKSDDYVEYDPFNLKGRHRPFGLKCQSSSSMVSTWDFFAGSTFNYGSDNLESKPEDSKSLIQFSKSEVMPLTPNLATPEGAKLRSDGLEAVSSQKRSDGSDVYSHAVDSPCWRGAPTARMSPFDVSEAVNPKPLVESDGLMYHGTSSVSQITTEPMYSTSNNVNGPSSDEQLSGTFCKIREGVSSHVQEFTQDKNIDEDGLKYIDTTFVSSEDGKEKWPQHPVNDHRSGECNDSDSVLDFCHSKQDAEHVRQSVDGPMFVFGSNPKLDLNSKFLAAQETGKKSKFTCKTNPEQVASAGNEKNEKHCDAASENTFFAVHSSAADNPQISPGHDASYSRSSETVPDLKLDVNIVVNTMKNLSELLHLRCSSNPSAISQGDRVSLKDIVDNLNACIGKEAVKNPPAEEVLPPGLGVSPSHETPVKKMATDGDIVQERELAGGHITRNGDTKINEGMQLRSDIFRRKDKNFQGSMSLKENMDMDYSVVQAIKSALFENIPSEEDKDSLGMLYKNLWLEAEAALCAATTRARLLHRMMKMEKCPSHKEEDMESPPITKVATDDAQGTADPVLVTADVSPSPGVRTQDPPSLTSSSSEIESSIMARCHLLNSRLSESDSVDTELMKSTEKGKSLPSVHFQSPGVYTNGMNGPSGNDMLNSLMARYTQGDSSSVKYERAQSPQNKYSLPSSDCHGPRKRGPDANSSSLRASDNDIEASVASRFQILKSGDERREVRGSEATKIPQKYVFESLEDNPASLQSIQELHASTSTVDDGSEASVLTRFHVLKNRLESSNTDSPQLPVKAESGMCSLGDGSAIHDLIQQATCAFGNEDGFSGWPLDNAGKPVPKWLNSQVVEGWYACSTSSDWEHVSREDLPRQN